MRILCFSNLGNHTAEPKVIIGSTKVLKALISRQGSSSMNIREIQPDI